MAENTINVKVKQRTDTESNWASKNPVLLKGEMAISSDKNNKYKIGDGTSVWSVLSYAKADLSKSDVTTALGYTPPTTNTTYNDVTQSAHGLMTAADKKKLDGIASGATKVTDSTVAGWGYKKTDTNTWRPLGTTADTACAGNDSRLSNARPANGGNSTTVNGHTVNSNVPANAKFTDTTYAIATTSANGLMSKDMVTKLNGIASGATAVTSTTVSNWGFKKTDTWRGVQNNLTSTATDQSLSAYQGKVLKDLVDKKATFTYSSTQPTSPASNAVWIG